MEQDIVSLLPQYTTELPAEMARRLSLLLSTNLNEWTPTISLYTYMPGGVAFANFTHQFSLAFSEVSEVYQRLPNCDL